MAARAREECGLGDYLFRTNPGLLESGGGDDEFSVDDFYRTIFPVAWFGSVGWRLYDKWIGPVPGMGAPPGGEIDSVDMPDGGIDMSALQRFPPRDPDGTASSPESAPRARRSDRPMGLFAPLFIWSPLRRITRWMAAHAVWMALVWWALLVAACLALELAPLEIIRLTTSGRYVKFALLVVVRFPVLAVLLRRAEVPLRVFRKLGGIPVLFLKLVLMPLYAVWVISTNPNATRVLLTIALLSAGTAHSLGAILDWRPEGSIHSVHSWLRSKGVDSVFSALYLMGGAFLLPLLACWLIRGATPRAAGWLFFDHLPIKELTLVLGFSAALATAFVFTAQFKAAMDEGDDIPIEVVAGVARALDVETTASTAIRHKAYLRSASFHAHTLASCLVAVILVRTIVAHVYPVAFAESRSRRRMLRTAAWRTVEDMMSELRKNMLSDQARVVRGNIQARMRYGAEGPSSLPKPDAAVQDESGGTVGKGAESAAVAAGRVDPAAPTLAAVDLET